MVVLSLLSVGHAYSSGDWLFQGLDFELALVNGFIPKISLKLKCTGTLSDLKKVMESGSTMSI